MLPTLDKQFGQDHAAKVRYAEPFEIADYGRRPDAAEMKVLFPMFSGVRV